MTIDQEEALEYMQTLAILNEINIGNANKIVALVRKQNKENAKMKLCGICKNYTQEDCECSLCGETVNVWETCEKWEFLGMEEK